jgi:hypothetical protein
LTPFRHGQREDHRPHDPRSPDEEPDVADLDDLKDKALDLVEDDPTR